MPYAFEPSMRSEVFSPDQLQLGSQPVLTDTVTLAAGLTLPRGTLIGQQTGNVYAMAAAAATTAGGANTGNGTIANLSAGAEVVAGTYRVNFTAATAFAVVDPEGETLGTGATGVAFASPQVGFTITAGGTAFAAGDGFSLVVEETAGSGAGLYVQATATATDGSEDPRNWLILAEDADTSATGANAATPVPVYVSGEFNADYMTFGPGLAATGVKTALRQVGSALFLKTSGVLNAIV